MSEELKVWFALATLFYVATFVVWSRLAHALRCKGMVTAAVLFIPLIVGAAIESVSCGWLAMSPVDSIPKAATFNMLISPMMGFSTFVVGAWGLVQLQCPEAGCARERWGGLMRELVKSVPD